MFLRNAGMISNLYFIGFPIVSNKNVKMFVILINPCRTGSKPCAGVARQPAAGIACNLTSN